VAPTALNHYFELMVSALGCSIDCYSGISVAHSIFPNHFDFEVVVGFGLRHPNRDSGLHDAFWVNSIAGNLVGN